MMDAAAQKAAVKNSRLVALPDMNDPQGNDTLIHYRHVFHLFIAIFFSLIFFLRISFFYTSLAMLGSPKM